MTGEQKEFPMQFDHTEAYDAQDGELGKRLSEIFEIAKKHGCPMLFMGISEVDDEVAHFILKTNARNDHLPDQMILARLILDLPPAQFDLLYRLVDIFMYANTNIEMVHSDIKNAVARELEHNANKHNNH